MDIHSPNNPSAYPPITAVEVTPEPEYEFYKVGQNGVDKIVWHMRDGEMSLVPSIVVFKDGKPHSEHPLRSCTSIYY